ncbi:MAG: TonB-dependent receptor domain-containing protein, partial [Oceanobacter sp.]
QKEHKQLPDYYRNSPNNRAELAKQQLEVQFSGQMQSEDSSWTHEWQMQSQRRNEHYTDPEATFGQTADNQLTNNRSKSASWKSTRAISFNDRNLPTWELGLHSSLEKQQIDTEQQDADAQDCELSSSQCDQSAQQRHRQAGISLKGETASGSQEWQLATRHHSVERLVKSSAVESSTSKSQEYSGLSGYWRFDLPDALLPDWLWAWWRVGYKRATRLPTLYEQFGDQGLMRGNDELKPELGRTLSLDSQWDFDLFDLPQRLQIKLFERQLENAMVTIYDVTGSGQYQNTGNATVTGLEWQLNNQLFDLISASGHQQRHQQKHQHQLHLQLSGSHYQSRTESDIKSSDNKQLPGIYHQKWLLQLKWQRQTQVSRQHLSLFGELADQLYHDSANLSMGDQKRLLGLDLGWTSSHFLSSADTMASAGLRIGNLTKNQFTDFSNRPSSGRSWQLYASLNF